MDTMYTPVVYEHEIAKHSDFQAGFESILRNTAALDRMLVSADTDYIVGGEVTAAAGRFAACVGKLWGNGLGLELPVFGVAGAEVAFAAPGGAERVDTLQVRAALEECESELRAFFNPETESGQYFNTPTKKRLVVECAALMGTEGSGIAPDAGAGWIKLAEVLIIPGAGALRKCDIRGVTAIYQGEENAAWTNEKARTFSLGSFLELKTILAFEHTAAGAHREKVIKAVNVDFGPGGGHLLYHTISGLF